MRNKNIYIIRVKFSFKFKHRPHGTSDIHLIDPKEDERLSQTRNPSVRNEHGSPGFLRALSTMSLHLYMISKSVQNSPPGYSERLLF